MIGSDDFHNFNSRPIKCVVLIFPKVKVPKVVYGKVHICREKITGKISLKNMIVNYINYLNFPHTHGLQQNKELQNGFV